MFHIRVIHFFGILKKEKVITGNIYVYFHKKNISQAYLIWTPKVNVAKTGYHCPNGPEIPPKITAFSLAFFQNSENL